MTPITEVSLKLGMSCATKALYHREGLPRSDEADPFAKWMNAETGKVRALARHFFPEAMDIPEGDEGNAFTHALLESGTPVARARFATDSASCRVDFAAREGATIRLYQVVAKAIDLRRYQLGQEFVGANGRIRSEWWSTIEIMAYRVGIVQKIWPQHRVMPFLIAPIDGAVGRVNGLHGMFEETNMGWRTTHPAAVGEAANLVRQFGITKECIPLVPSVGAKVDRLIKALENPPPPQLSYSCRKCEFRVPGSGFDRCWGALKDVSPSAWEMPWLYFIQEKGVPVFNRLARAKTIGLADIPTDLIQGEHAARQRMFLECTASQKEIIKPDLALALNGLQFPLHFLDIEALRTVLPLGKGSRGCGITCFQFSNHTISSPGAEPTHSEFLDSEEGDPNRRFLRALRTALGDHGSTAVWSGFECSVFRELRETLLRAEDYDADVRWLDQLIMSDRLVDQYDLCLRHYINPKMGGSASIKKVVSAIWSEDTPAKQGKLFDGFPRDVDPYIFMRESGGVSDGVAAITGYLAMMTKNGSEREDARKDLLRYCYVDSAAEILIYRHWIHLLNQPTRVLPKAMEAAA